LGRAAFLHSIRKPEVATLRFGVLDGGSCDVLEVIGGKVSHGCLKLLFLLGDQVKLIEAGLYTVLVCCCKPRMIR
jgi:hypothetical protein